MSVYLTKYVQLTKLSSYLIGHREESHAPGHTSRAYEDISDGISTMHPSPKAARSPLDKTNSVQKFQRRLSFNENQISTTIPDRRDSRSPRAAVIVSEAVKSYGGPNILNNFSMTVEKGTM
jgi:hypothetical protein